VRRYIFTGGFILEIPLGRNIRQLRLERNMTQRQLAWHLSVSVQAVSKWERGCAYPDLALLIPIALLFDVTLDALFGREDVG
jgi:transcriptional regulator with XRE-family HTH domain